ncbi:MAG: PAS domain S-box protein, partial [Xanthobacteraceae bacterium]
MLEQFSERVRECYEFAAEARAKADATNDSALKAELLNAERRWLVLAQSFGFTESLKDFTTANAEQRRWVDYFLRAKKVLAPAASFTASAELWSIIDNSDDAIITKNLDGIISSWNKSAERIFGYTAAEVVGKSVTILIPPDRHDEEPAILARLRRGERTDHYETVRRRK